MITIDKKDARILWNVDWKDGKRYISDFLVEEFILDPITKKYNNQHLYEKYHKDIGNCLADWDAMTNAEILFLIFFSGITTDGMQLKIFTELFKIKEFRQELKFYMHWFFTDDELDEYAEYDTTTTQK